MRPLLVTHTAAPGGSNRVLLALLDGAPTGVEPAVVVLADGPLVGELRARGVPVAIVHSGRARDAWRAPGTVRNVLALMRAHRADVAFSHLAKAHLYTGPAARLAGVPALWWQHALPGQQALLHRAAEGVGASAIVCSSEFTAALQRVRTPRTPVFAIQPGTPPVDAPPHAPREPDSGPVLGVVGRLQRYKRIERLLGAMPAILAAVPSTRLEVIGGSEPLVDPGYEDELRRRAQALGVAQAVTFTGHVDDARARIGRLDVLVHVAELEPFGLVVLEAMARGVPVVAAHGGGPTEIVRDGVDGLLVDVSDPTVLATAVVRLLRDPLFRGRMGDAGRELARTRFAESRMVMDAWSVVFQAAN